MSTAPKSRTEAFDLDYPVEHKGALLSKLTIRRPKGVDLRFLPSGSDATIDRMYPFFALLTGVEESVFDEMDAADLSRFGDVINGFLASSPKAKSPSRPAG